MKTLSLTVTLTDEQHAALDAERLRYNKANENNPKEPQATDVAQFVGMMCQSNMRSRADNLNARSPEQVKADEVQTENARLKEENEKLRKQAEKK